MKHLILLLLLATLSQGQIRENQAIPMLAKKPVSILEKGITGWCKSPDGQWMEAANTIPLRLNSNLPESERKQERKIGSDNIQSLSLYPIKYGKDTLVMIVKQSKTGYFEFSETRENWRTKSVAWYFVFEKQYLMDVMSNATEVVSTQKIPLLAEGKITGPGKDVTERILSKLNLTTEIDHDLILTSRTAQLPSTSKKSTKPINVFHFQFFSFHPISRDVSGVAEPFAINGKPLMGKDELLEYCYYEVELSAWQDFLSANLQEAKY